VKILVADDDPVANRLLTITVSRAGYEVLSVADGEAAWSALEKEDAPRIAILDWMMPGLDGPEICRRVRERANGRYRYLLLLTARSETDDLVAGLAAGADDFLRKPFDPAELEARLRVGQRIVSLEESLRARVAELEQALAHVRQLQGLLPICMFCKKIRDDRDSWQKIESYISEHTDAQFSHSICEDCLREHYPEQARALSRKKDVR
jgi:DNA-binding response OmpR family regulator